jgi:hypothetical protein
MILATKERITACLESLAMAVDALVPFQRIEQIRKDKKEIVDL